jgi:hypothetical protein
MTGPRAAQQKNKESSHERESALAD